jgi:hypothetical protein
LLSPPEQSSEALWLAKTYRLRANAGDWSAEVRAMFGDDFEGGRWTTREWPSGVCPACGSDALDQAA